MRKSRWNSISPKKIHTRLINARKLLSSIECQENAHSIHNEAIAYNRWDRYCQETDNNKFTGDAETHILPVKMWGWAIALQNRLPVLYTIKQLLQDLASPRLYISKTFEHMPTQKLVYRWWGLLMDTRFLFYNKSILECGDGSTACRYTKKNRWISHFKDLLYRICISCLKRVDKTMANRTLSEHSQDPSPSPQPNSWQRPSADLICIYLGISESQLIRHSFS